MKNILICSILIILSSFSLFSENVRDSVVKIYNTKNKYDYKSPWKTPEEILSSSTGFVIHNHRILTNAHCVANSAILEVKLEKEAKHYAAYIEQIDHDCDLAILSTVDKAFFYDVKPLSLADTYDLGKKNKVYGFAFESDHLSVFDSTMIKNEITANWPTHREFLSCISNFYLPKGFSGSPVLSNEEKVVGVIFQRFSSHCSIISLPILRHFLDECNRDKYLGFPNHKWLTCQIMENACHREFYHMSENQKGILIKKVDENSCFGNYLFPGDIILEIDGIPLDNDGTFLFNNENRLNWSILISNKYYNDIINMKILRDGKVLEIAITITENSLPSSLIPSIQYDHPPTYFILGGIVFQPLDENYMRYFWGNAWYYQTSNDLLRHYFFTKPTSLRKEIVLINRILFDPINLGYQMHHVIVSKVNGKTILDMQDLVQTFETCQDDYYLITLENGEEIVLRRDLVKNSHNELLNRHGISYDRSNDLN